MEAAHHPLINNRLLETQSLPATHLGCLAPKQHFGTPPRTPKHHQEHIALPQASSPAGNQTPPFRVCLTDYQGTERELISLFFLIYTFIYMETLFEERLKFFFSVFCCCWVILNMNEFNSFGWRARRRRIQVSMRWISVDASFYGGKDPQKKGRQYPVSCLYLIISIWARYFQQ